MDGIQKITAKIEADARAEIEQIHAKAKAQVEEIADASRAKARSLAEELSQKGKRLAAEREERMGSMAQMDAQKVYLAAKQEMLDKAFDRALEKLCSLESDVYIKLLAELLVKASRTGREQVAFSQKDHSGVGKAAISKANEMLAKAVAPELPDVLTETKVGAIVDKVVTGVSAMAQGTAMLTLAEEGRNIKGGFILIDGKVETNCAFETLVRLEKTNMSGEVSKILFD